MVEKITDEELELYAQKVRDDIKYGGEGILIDEALKNNPLNNDKSLVAMKICLIDITNGTNLSRNLGKDGGLFKLSQKIVDSNFDERVKNGDTSIIPELAKWTKKEFGKNLFSFITKYCLYHNVHCYNKDDYAIFDSVVSKSLHKYISEEDYEILTGNKLRYNSFFKMKDEYNYDLYLKIIDFIIEKNKISVENPHRKLDWFIWYKNRI